MEEATAQRLVVALEALATMQAVDLLQERYSNASNKDKIAALDLLGFAPEKVARLVGTTLGTVKKELSILKSGGGKNE